MGCREARRFSERYPIMKRRLRIFAIFFSAIIGLSICSSASSGNPVKESDQPKTRSAKSGAPPSSTDPGSALIPGPLRSFMRMAAISQKVTPEDVLPLLARNVFMQGYQRGTPTEFLLLLERYIQQARELQILAGTNHTIHVASCDDAGTLVQILGYRLREGCGSKIFFLETANPERAFLTIDLGFPLTELEESLQTGFPLFYPYAPTKYPHTFKDAV